MKKLIVAVCMLGLAGMSWAGEQARIDRLNQVMEQTLGAKPDSIRPVIADTLYEARFEGEIFYLTATGSHLINGEVFDLATRVNLTERSRGEARIGMLSQLNPREMITYPAKGKEKHVINVFTDIDCGYCRRLHREMAQYNDLGITVRYLAFPRSPAGSESFNRSVSVWCARDRNKAMDDAKLNQRVSGSPCENAPVGKQQQLGQQMGVTGTPAILLSNGVLIPGYMPAARLLEAIEERM